MPDLIPAPNGYPIKLVRDGTASVINGSGEAGELFYGPAKGDTMRWLRLKLAEEVGEYLVDGGFDELADVQAVLEALSVAHGRSVEELRTAVESHPRGGFSEAVMMYGRHAEFDRSDPPPPGERGGG